MTLEAAGAPHEAGYRPIPRSAAEAALHVAVALVLTIVSVSCFAASTVFGVVATGLLTATVAIALPASIPVVIVTSFLYQNMVVAWFTPYIIADHAFDALRGANFVILMAAYAVFCAASFKYSLRRVTALRPWLLWAMAISGIIVVYLAIGAAHGHPKDAIVYFRNTITPLAAFHIAVVAASLYRIDLRKSLSWLIAGAIVYGYCELIFMMKFLSLFNGDLYIERDIRRQIESGQWEKTMHETGFVLRGLKDVMMTTFFNTPLFAHILPPVFRIGGPNFHSISYAYALAIVSAWLLFRGRWLLPLAALPLLLVIGSKGAMFLLLLALGVRFAYNRLGPRPTFAAVLALSAGWLAAAIAYGATHGDYHVLGFLAGLHDFLRAPQGQGLGIGGNLSSTSFNLNWERAQATGATSVPVESAIGVMLYQMGAGSLVFLGFLAALARYCGRLALKTAEPDFVFAFVAIVAMSANAVLQEEAFYSPLALGLTLLLVGAALGTHWREAADAVPGAGLSRQALRAAILRSQP